MTCPPKGTKLLWKKPRDRTSFVLRRFVLVWIGVFVGSAMKMGLAPIRTIGACPTFIDSGRRLPSWQTVPFLGHLFRDCTGLLLLGWVAAPLGAAPPITAAVFSPDGQAVILGSQSGIEVRSWPDLQSLRDMETRLPHVHDLAFSPHGDLLAASGGTPAENGMIELYRWPDAVLLDGRAIRDDLIYALSWRPDAVQLAVASLDRSVSLRRIDRSSPSVLGPSDKSLQGHSQGVLAIAYLPAGDFLVSAGIDQSLRLWEVASGQLRRTLDNHTDDVRDLAVRPQTDAALPMIASASADRTIRLWQPTIGRLVRFARLPSEPLAIDWTPDGRTLLAGCVDGHLRAIDPETVQITMDRGIIDGWAYAVAAAPDGQSALVGGANGQIQRVPLLLPSSGKSQRVLQGAR